jgi:aminoglycoside phosphotransferase (APT) family kinase protein
MTNGDPVTPRNDVIEMRPDERIDEARVADYLRGKLPGSERPLTIHQFGGGAANLTYLLSYGSHQYVLRRPPLGNVAKSAHDMNREYSVLSVLYRAFPYAPRAYLYSDDETIVGAPFFLMERRHGVVVRRALPATFANLPSAPRQMSEALVDALVELHAVDYEALGLGDLGRPIGFVDRQIEGWYRRWHAAKTEDLADMDNIYTWLKANQPATRYKTLLHNDYKLDNVMLAADDPGRMIAIFDWDMCTLGDPLCDLGTLLTYWTQPTDPRYMQRVAMMPRGELGFMTRKELVARYAQKSGRDVGEINFYHALGLYRLVVIMAQIHIRYVLGQTQDERFSVFGEMIPLFARAAAEVSTA